MATIHFTLDSNDILYMLKHDSSGAFAMLLQNSLNQLMQIESNEQLKARPYERTEERTDLRNGTREALYPHRHLNPSGSTLSGSAVSYLSF